MTIDQLAAHYIGHDEPLRVYADVNIPEGKQLITYLEENHISYHFIPTRWAEPELAYGPRIVVGLARVLEFLRAKF